MVDQNFLKPANEEGLRGSNVILQIIEVGFLVTFKFQVRFSYLVIIKSLLLLTYYKIYRQTELLNTKY